MTWLTLVVACFWIVATALHLASLVLVAGKVRSVRSTVPRRSSGTLVSLIRPINGLEPEVEQVLRSGFRLDDPNYEIIFCAHEEGDPAVPIVQRLMAEYAGIASKLLIGTAELGGNPKLNNIAKGWLEAKGEWVIFSDGNIELPPDYIARLLSAWTSESGAGSTVHIGTRPVGFWAEAECAFLNQFQARWHMFSALVGTSFAHGKTMLVQRSDLEAAGGIAVLASEIAEDVALTKLVWSKGRTVVALYRPVEQPLGLRTARELWQRQARWARLRRWCYPRRFMIELLAGSLLPMLAAAFTAWSLGASPSTTALAQLFVWYGSEWAFVHRVGWHWSWLAVPGSLVRDLSIPVIWFYAWFGSDFRWGEKAVYGKD